MSYCVVRHVAQPSLLSYGHWQDVCDVPLLEHQRRDDSSVDRHLLAGAQVASMELGAVLGEPLPLESIRIGDACSDMHPNNGATWSSTGSESSCAVRRQ